MREQLLDKLQELRDLFDKATCEGKPIEFDGEFDDEVSMDIGAALYTLETLVSHYID